MLKELNQKPHQLFCEAHFSRSCLPALTKLHVLHWKCLIAKISMVRVEMDVLLWITLEQFKRLLPPAFHYFPLTGSYCLCI